MSACGKIRYESKADAKVGARRRRHHGHVLGRPYRCLKCNEWHLSNRAAAEDRAFHRARRRGEAEGEHP